MTTTELTFTVTRSFAASSPAGMSRRVGRFVERLEALGCDVYLETDTPCQPGTTSAADLDDAVASAFADD